MSRKCPENGNISKTTKVFLWALNVESSFVLNVVQNERKYFRSMATHKENESDAYHAVLVDCSMELNATAVPTSVIFGHGYMRHRDEDLSTW